MFSLKLPSGSLMRRSNNTWFKCPGLPSTGIQFKSCCTFAESNGVSPSSPSLSRTHALPLQSRVVACMTAILSQMDDRHYATYIETFTKTSDLVVSARTRRHTHQPANVLKPPHAALLLWNIVSPAAGLPDGILPAFQGSHRQTCLPLWLDGHDHGTKQVTYNNNDNNRERPL